MSSSWVEENNMRKEGRIWGQGFKEGV